MRRVYKIVTNMFAPYMIVADWGKTRVHYTWSRKEAMSWMSAYPNTATVAVYNSVTNDVVARCGIN